MKAKKIFINSGVLSVVAIPIGITVACSKGEGMVDLSAQHQQAWTNNAVRTFHGWGGTLKAAKVQQSDLVDTLFNLRTSPTDISTFVADIKTYQAMLADTAGYDEFDGLISQITNRSTIDEFDNALKEFKVQRSLITNNDGSLKLTFDISASYGNDSSSESFHQIITYEFPDDISVTK